MEICYQIEEKISPEGDRVNTDIFRSIDNILRLEFKNGEIWELINEIFIKWENIGIKKNKKPKGINH